MHKRETIVILTKQDKLHVLNNTEDLRLLWNNWQQQVFWWKSDGIWRVNSTTFNYNKHGVEKYFLGYEFVFFFLHLYESSDNHQSRGISPWPDVNTSTWRNSSSAVLARTGETSLLFKREDKRIDQPFIGSRSRYCCLSWPLNCLTNEMGCLKKD